MQVLITGAAGNLGGKLIAHLQTAAWCRSIVGIDPKPLDSVGKLRAFAADLRDPDDRRWTDAVADADAIVHFAAENPWPDSAWWEAALSIDMTLNLLNRIGDRSCRFVFASSNHVMGGYKDTPLPAGELLTATTPPLPGTRFFDGVQYRTPMAYGSSKLTGERAVAARAAVGSGRFTGVNVRIGWVQRGENRPDTLNPNGGGTPRGSGQADPAEINRAMAWFRGMWLSNRDFVQLMERALIAPATSWPGPVVTVNGVSNNTGTRWSMAESQELLGYTAVDDVAHPRP